MPHPPLNLILLQATAGDWDFTIAITRLAFILLGGAFATLLGACVYSLRSR